MINEGEVCIGVSSLDKKYPKNLVRSKGIPTFAVGNNDDMVLDEQKIVNNAHRTEISDGIERVLREAAPRKAHAILFGSRARGDARQQSDWDVLILLDKDRITPADMDNISYPIRQLGWEIDEMINPIMYTVKEWEAKSFTPFYKNVMKEGIAL